METMYRPSSTDHFLADYEAIAKAMQHYIDGARAGNVNLCARVFMLMPPSWAIIPDNLCSALFR